MRALTSALVVAAAISCAACGGGGAASEPPDVVVGTTVDPLPVPEPSPTPEPATADRACGEIPEPGRDRIRWAQRSLNDLGYDCGVVDGLAGPNTEGCIEDFQTDLGLEPTGLLTPVTRQEIACAVGPE